MRTLLNLIKGRTILTIDTLITLKKLITKKKGHYFVCGKIGHYVNQCRYKAQRRGDNKKSPKANMTEGEGDEIIATVVVSEMNMVDGHKN